MVNINETMKDTKIELRNNATYELQTPAPPHKDADFFKLKFH